MTESSLVESARRWVIDNYPYNRDHLLRSLEWLDRIAPGSSEATRLAALTHDMERAFPGPDSPRITRLCDPEYERLHSQRSARIVAEWLRDQRADEAMVRDVEALILAHETGGSREADLVQTADSLSFLDTNVDLFLGFARSGRFTIADVRAKFELTYHRIRVPHARAIALPMFELVLAKLASLEQMPARHDSPNQHGSPSTEKGRE
jgi:hypothetical protein